MRYVFLFLLANGLLCTGPVHAQNCQAEDSVPAGQKRLGGGSATADYDGITKVKGGQSVHVKIKNENLVGVSYSIKVVADGSPEVPICTYKALLPARTSAILSGAQFADPPISWKVVVSVGSESDAGVLTYEVFSNPK
jgi:hypothetical protein